MTAARPLRGSCLCGGIRVAITGPLTDAVHCHCLQCRKAQGTAFRTRASARTQHLRLTEGEALLQAYCSSPGCERCFRRRCGSPVLSRFPQQPDHLGIPLGLRDEGPGVRPLAHVYVASQAPWYRITDAPPQFAQLPSHSHPFTRKENPA